MSVLYMVGVPIGNLQDITLRALETLRTVDLIACEDTRHSSILLRHFEIQKPLISCHGYNEDRAAGRVVQELSAGKRVAFISDAGTPGLSDPGGRLVEAAVAGGFRVVPIPGPSAFSSLISVLGLPGKRLVFEGFLSPKAGRRRRQLQSLFKAEGIAVVFESPFRIMALLEDIQTLSPTAHLVLGRELTKIHEEILRGTAENLIAVLAAKPAIKGEFVVAIAPADPPSGDDEQDVVPD